MMCTSATAVAHPNIAFVKYWGNRDQSLRLPSNGSFSMNLGALETRTTVTLHSSMKADTLIINGIAQTEKELERVQQFMHILRQICGAHIFTEISSQNNFPASAGLASSASAFAALAVAGAAVFNMMYTENQLSRLARLGSGSAARSIPEGFVEWQAGKSDIDSYAFSIAPVDHWDLWDCIALVATEQKKTGSTEGHQLAETSPLQAARVEDTPRRLDVCRSAIMHKDFQLLADLIELDSHMMHAVMLTSNPSLMYWESTSVTIMNEVSVWRRQGIPAAFTMDAGPNVHVICTAEYAEVTKGKLSTIPGVRDVLASPVGYGARLILPQEGFNTD